jgi:hypothetical protein
MVTGKTKILDSDDMWSQANLDDDDDDTWPHSQTKFWTLMMIHGHSDN